MKPFQLLFTSMLAGATKIAPAAWADEGSAMGMVGITRDPLIRVSLFHDANVAGAIYPSIVEIVAANGKVLASSKAELFPGTGTFFDYDLAQALKKGDRLQVHVIVRTQPDHPGGAYLETTMSAMN